MPWHVVEDSAECPSSKPFAVVLDDGGKVVGCHPTKKDAIDHLAALNANANAATVEPISTKEMLELQGWSDAAIAQFRGAGTRKRTKAEKGLTVGFARALGFVERRVEAAVRDKATTLVAGPVSLNPHDVYQPAWWATGVKRYVRPGIDAFYGEVSASVGGQLGVDPAEHDDDSEDLDRHHLELLALMYGSGQESWVIDQVTAAIDAGEDLTALTDSLTADTGRFAGNWASNFGAQLTAQIWNVAAITTGALAARAMNGEPPKLDDTGQVINPDESTATSYTPDQLLKRWVSMRDERVRDTHQDVDDEVSIPLDEDFMVGGNPAARPGDPRLPVEEVANCRCILEITAIGGNGDEMVLSIDQLDEIDPALADNTGDEGLQAAAELHAEVERWNDGVTRMHTHGKCRKCGGYLTGIKGCENCGGGYHAPGKDAQPSQPSQREHPTVVLPTTTQATLAPELADAGTVAPGGVPEEAIMPAAPSPTIQSQPGKSSGEFVPWRGIIAVEGVPTGDRRLFAEGSLWWDDRYLPFDLFVMARDPEGGDGHDGSEIGGRVDKLWRVEREGFAEIWAEGVYDTSLSAGETVARLQQKNMLRGVSIDVDSVEQIESAAAGHVDLPGARRMEAYSRGRIRRITVCSIPAFIEASISPITESTEVVPGVAAIGQRAAFDVKFNPSGCVGKGDKTDQWAVMDGNQVVDCFPTRAEAVDAQAKVNAKASARRQYQVGDAVDMMDVLHYVARDEGTCGADRPWAVVAPDGSTVACFEGRYDAYEAARDLDEDMFGDDAGWDGQMAPEGDGGEGDEDESVQVVIISSGARRRVSLVDRLRVWTPVKEFGDDTAEQTLVASAAPGAVFSSALVDADPPAEVFQRREYSEFTPATISADGRISGHAVPHGECHIGFTNRCVMAPKSVDGYRYARAGGHVLCAGGEMVPVARIFAQFTPGRRAHAPEEMGATDAKKWYENQCAVVADVALYDDGHGIQVQGRVRPGISRHQLVAFRASDLSPDWRTIRGRLECIGLACVNVSGFPSRYNNLPALVASGAEVGLEIDVPEEAEMIGSVWIAGGKVRTLVASAVHPAERGSNLVLMSAIERMACRIEDLEQNELARQAAALLADVPTEDQAQAELEALVASAMEGLDLELEPSTTDGDPQPTPTLTPVEIETLQGLLAKLAEGQRPPRRCDGCGGRMSYDQNTCSNCGRSYAEEAAGATTEVEGDTKELEAEVPVATG